ncbi:hypothetical protein O1611_g4769 [Lasiodiplodia mahajangana]|uniref:Uncharacterized protein n=1 Tax=Lasiodiplodia mahajangana TaxID=1108764 RepID=A0ACC2JN91_9PEZI|nr:hypothetical protein O1611_g4769 [Lasiodiplodia mahajangana]
MELSSPFAPTQPETFPSEINRMASDDVTREESVRLPRKASLSTNFSYPRLSRHESSQSRSSNGSLPGMTDASDSEFSIDEDGSYNTSAGELWDSFWPDSTTSSIGRKPQHHGIESLQSEPSRDHFRVNPAKRRYPSDVDSDAVRIAAGEDEILTTPRHPFQPPQSQSVPNQSAASYSVYPQPQVTRGRRHLHPPRTSSLSFEPPSPPQLPLYMADSRPRAVLKPSKSTHNINSLFIPPSLASQNKDFPSEEVSPLTTTSKPTSFPASPAYPPPPPPRPLRVSSSAVNLRDKPRGYSNNNGIALDAIIASPLLPSALPEELPTRPQPERFVSVFEYDSDSEAGDERDSFARRITRGLHRKSASEKRSTRKASVVRHTPFDAKSPERYSRERPRSSGRLNRGRGGSLGRIFGLMGR